MNEIMKNTGYGTRRPLLAVAVAVAAVAMALIAPPTAVGATLAPGLPQSPEFEGEFERSLPPFAVPNGGSIVVSAEAGDTVATARTVDGELYLTARARGDKWLSAEWTLPNRRIAHVSWTHAADRPATPVMSSKKKLKTANCSNSTYSWFGWSWGGGTWSWWFNSGSTPFGLNVANTETAFRNAMSEWANVSDWCGVSDSAALSISYQGQLAPASAFGNNGVSSVGFAASPCGLAGVVGCTASWGAGGTITEADTRLNNALSWSNAASTPAGVYDVQSAQAHESGSGIGFGNSANGNVMYSVIASGQNSERFLGWGDALGVNAVY